MKKGPTQAVVRPRIIFTIPQTTAEDTASVVSNRSTTSSTPRKADEAEQHLWKQVAKDIEEAGGIALFVGKDTYSLARLLNSKNNPLYNGQGVEDRKKLRRRIQSYVYRWQKWHKEGKYEDKVLLVYGVKSALQRQKEADARKKAEARKRKRNIPHPLEKTSQLPPRLRSKSTSPAVP